MAVKYVIPDTISKKDFTVDGGAQAVEITALNTSGQTDHFTAAATNDFITGTAAGDGGLRVSAGKTIYFGESTQARVIIVGAAGNDAAMQLFAGQSAAVSASNTGRLRYNASTQKFQTSLNTAAYLDILDTGTGALQATTLTAGNGLTGGGDLSTSRTFDVGAGSGILSNANDVAVNQGFAFNWTAIHSWKIHSAFTGSASNLTTGAVQTTDGTQTTAFSFTLADTTLYWFKVVIIARDTGGTDRALYERRVLVYRQGGGATIEGAVQVISTDVETVGATTWDVTFTTNSNDVRVSVTGAAATTINWVCTVTYQAVSGNT